MAGDAVDAAAGVAGAAVVVVKSKASSCARFVVVLL